MLRPARLRWLWPPPRRDRGEGRVHPQGSDPSGVDNCRCVSLRKCNITRGLMLFIYERAVALANRDE